MTITKKIVLDENGEPSEVIIPYAQFMEITEVLGLDLDQDEREELREAISDSKAGNRDAFLPASEV